MSLDPKAWERLRDMAPKGAEKEFFAELIAVFVKTTPAIVHGLRAALESQNQNDIYEQAHRLKGMCLGLGIVELSCLAEALEEGARSGGSITVTTETIAAVYAAAISELKAFLLN